MRLSAAGFTLPWQLVAAQEPGKVPIIKALAEGKLAITPRMAADPKWRKLIAAAYQYDPTFDAIDYNARNRELQKRAFVPRRLFNVKPKLKTTSASRHQMLAPNAVVGNWQWQPQLLTARRSGNIECLGWIKIALMPKSCVG